MRHRRLHLLFSARQRRLYPIILGCSRTVHIRTIPYFQAHTNTYAPVGVLRPLFYDALSFDGAVGLDIATRADCLPEDVTSLLAEIAEKTDLTVELGLQSSDDRTAKLIGRGHDFAAFGEGYRRLRNSSPRISICVHIIL